jgi:hypothetical protein
MFDKRLWNRLVSNNRKKVEAFEEELHDLMNSPTDSGEWKEQVREAIEKLIALLERFVGIARQGIVMLQNVMADLERMIQRLKDLLGSF